MIRVTVESVDNGYIVRSPEGCVVCEDDDSDKGEHLAAAHMLYAVLDAVGMSGSKHDPYRVWVSVISRDTGEDVLA